MVRKLMKRDIQKRLDKVQKNMPFHDEVPMLKQPRSMKDRQQMWVLAGLKHLRAPVVFWIAVVVGLFLFGPKCGFRM